MQLLTLTLRNFGLHRGEHRFDLTPAAGGIFNRPVAAISGKNGVGKSTLMEALRVRLHGPLALGSRTSKADYQRYLKNALNLPLTPDEEKLEAQITGSKQAARPLGPK